MNKRIYRTNEQMREWVNNQSMPFGHKEKDDKIQKLKTTSLWSNNIAPPQKGGGKGITVLRNINSNLIMQNINYTSTYDSLTSPLYYFTFDFEIESRIFVNPLIIIVGINCVW